MRERKISAIYRHDSRVRSIKFYKHENVIERTEI